VQRCPTEVPQAGDATGTPERTFLRLGLLDTPPPGSVSSLAPPLARALGALAVTGRLGMVRRIAVLAGSAQVRRGFLRCHQRPCHRALARCGTGAVGRRGVGAQSRGPAWGQRRPSVTTSPPVPHLLGGDCGGVDTAARAPARVSRHRWRCWWRTGRTAEAACDGMPPRAQR